MSGPAPRVAVLGDSQAEGLIPHLREPLRAAGYAPTTLVSYRGASSSRLATHVDEVLAGSPDLVVLTAGGNDDEGDASRWRDLARRVTAQGAMLVWMTPPDAEPAGSALDLARARIASAIERALAGSPRVRVVSGRELFAGLVHANDVHFVGTSYAEAARRLARALAREPARAGTGAGSLALVALGAFALAYFAASSPGSSPPR